MRLPIVLLVGVLSACYDDGQCNPSVALKTSFARSPSYNEAEWVYDYRVPGYGVLTAENNTLMIEGKPARRDLLLVDTASCSEGALRVRGPAGASVQRLPSVLPPGVAGEGPVEIVDVRVDWVPSQAGKVPLSVGRVVNLELEVARDLTSLEPAAVLPRQCEFVGRLGRSLVCDSWIYDEDGGGKLLGDYRVYDVQGLTMLALAGDGGANAYLHWSDDRRSFDVGYLDAGAVKGAVKPVLVGNVAYYEARQKLNAVDTLTGAQFSVPEAQSPRALSRVGSTLVWLDGPASGAGNRLCRLGPNKTVECIVLEGIVAPVGTDQAIWLQVDLDGTRKLVAWYLDGNDWKEANGPHLASRGPGGGPLGLGPPFFQASRPGLYASRSICAFRMVKDGHIGVAVLPEGDVYSHRMYPLFARGDGRDGLLWCSDLLLTKTFVYQPGI